MRRYWTCVSTVGRSIRSPSSSSRATFRSCSPVVTVTGLSPRAFAISRVRIVTKTGSGARGVSGRMPVGSALLPPASLPALGHPARDMALSLLHPEQELGVPPVTRSTISTAHTTVIMPCRPPIPSRGFSWRRFAADSPLEGDGFEPSVPQQIAPVFENGRTRSRQCEVEPCSIVCVQSALT